MKKIIFFGTDIFAKIMLENLLKNNTKIDLVITKPNEKIEKKQELQDSKVAILAKENNIPYLKPEKLNEIKEDLEKLNSDIFIVAEYGKIIPESILNIPKYGAINIHGSILPKYRGASPIQYSLLNNDTETGITIIQMDKEMDHGNIIKIEKLKVEESDTQIILREKLAKIGAESVIKILNENNFPLNSTEQNHKEATYTKLIEKHDGEINLEIDTVEKIMAKYKAYQPWPGIYLIENNKRIKINEIDYKIHKKEDTDIEKNHFIIRKKELFLKDKNNNLLKILKLKLEGKNEITAADYINQIR